MGQYGSYEKLVKQNKVLDSHIALNAAAATLIFNELQPEPITVTRFGFVPTVVFALTGGTVTEGLLTIYRYPVANGTGKVALATIALKNGYAVDEVYYVDVPNPAVPPVKNAYGVITTPGRNKADIDAGERVVIEVTTEANASTETGNYQPFICYHPRAEVAANQGKMHNLTP